MRTTWLVCVAAFAAAAAGGCPSVTPTETTVPPLDGPTVDFDPANSIVPFPNNLVRVNGKVALPQQCNETPIATATRTGLLNTLDGFGNYETALTATFSAKPDLASLQNGTVVLYERLSRGSAVDPANAKVIATTVQLTQTIQYEGSNCGSGAMTDEAVIIPVVPLDEQSTYDVAILAGVTTNGSAFIPSATWALVRQPDDPVTVGSDGTVISSSTPIQPSQGSAAIAELIGLDTLWKFHAPMMSFLAAAGHANQNVLVAWEFTTQTTTDPLDASILGSPAEVQTHGTGGSGSAPALAFTQSLLTAGPESECPAVGLTAPCTAEAFLTAALPHACAGSGANQGGYLACSAVGDIVGGLVPTINYQTKITNPLAGGASIPGPWTDPINPTVQNAQLLVQYIGFVPGDGTVAGGSPTSCGSAGCPTVVFGHGLGSSKTSLAAIAPTYAAAGFASVAIDFVNSGGRAIQTSNDPALNCCALDDSSCTGSGSDQPASLDPTANHQCFASILSTDLAQTRDNFRQSILDVQRLVLSAQACGSANCLPLSVDPAHVVYGGISLGGILGTAITATANINTAMLSVPGVGWLDVLENTLDAPDISCPLVDALIANGILTGDPSGSTYSATGAVTVTDPNALCLQQDPALGIYTWREQLGYQQFSAIARWALDPGDPANFLKFINSKKVLEEEVIGDQVVSNVAGSAEGTLLELSPQAADPEIGVAGASAAVGSAMQSTWVQYSNLAETASPPFPGNAYQHASLLEPASSGSSALPSVTVVSPQARVLGTIRMQTDGVTFLINNK